MEEEEFNQEEADLIYSTINFTPLDIRCGQCESKNDWYTDPEFNGSGKLWIRCGKCKRKLHRNVLNMLPHFDTGPEINMRPIELNVTHTYEHDDKKLDQGKVMAGVLEDFLPALMEVAKLGSMNNKPYGKYERGSWMEVENAEQRYLDGFWRHILAGRRNIDRETDMPHDVAIAWNAIALVWFRLKREGKI
jgi:hypothetical protein